jgi:hypothetical protein
LFFIVCHSRDRAVVDARISGGTNRIGEQIDPPPIMPALATAIAYLQRQPAACNLALVQFAAGEVLRG